MWKGVKMIRFPFPTDVSQRAGWSQGVQIRFTDDFKQKLSRRDLNDPYRIYFHADMGMHSTSHDLLVDIECFMLTGLIPFERRAKDSQLINCLSLIESPNFEPSKKDIPEKTDTVANVYNCEQGSNLQNIDTSDKTLEDNLTAALKTAIKAGISFVPLAGPFLTIGVDVLYEVYNDRNKFKAAMEGAGIESTGEVAKLIFEKIGLAIKQTKRF